MRRLLNIITIAAFLLSSLAFPSEAEAGEGLFIPCQYKNTYIYYMSRGNEYFADSQLESAMDSFKKALIVQPNSKEARLKILEIRRMLKAGITPEIIEARKNAVEDAIMSAEEKVRQRIEEEKKPKVIENAIMGAEEKVRQRIEEEKKPKVAKDVPRVYRKSRYKAKGEQERPKAARRAPRTYRKTYGEARPEVERELEALEEELAQRYPSQSHPYLTDKEGFRLPTSYDKFYNEYLDPQKFSNGLNDKIQEAGEGMNNYIAPSKVKGEYRLSLGFTGDDAIWKDANADYHNMPGDTSWRYIFGNERYNNYDKKIYSRIKVELDSPITDKLSSYNEIVIDPWTFVGKKKVYLTGSAGDSAEVDLKYWSNATRTINETYRTQNGDIVNIQESKVHDGKTSPETYRGLADWGSNRFSMPQVEIDRMYVPVRKSWIKYESEPYHAKLFFMANQDEALTSDDPMRLSNNKVWWGESPWLDEYESSRTFNRGGISAPAGYGRTREPLKKGQWVRSQSFMAKDSDDQYLTFLRGLSLDGNFDNGTTVNMVVASPRNLWDEYQQGSSLPAAIRMKSPVTEKLTLGGLYTLKTGFRHQSVEAMNNLAALDASYDLYPDTKLLAEAAVSNMDVEESIGYNNVYTGYAGMIGLKNSGPLTMIGRPSDKYELETSFTHMGDQFFPGLSSYRFTRKEPEYAKHIHFDELKPENEAIKVGDGVDVGRNSFGLTAKAEFPDDNIDGRLDFRSVHSDGGDFIENVYRAEGTYKPAPKLTLKGLAYFQHLPETTLGIDPLINAKNSYSAFTDYFAYEDVWLENTTIESGSDPSIGTFSGGAKYDFYDYLSATGVIEVTNDPKDWPRGLLNNVYVTDEHKDGVIWDKIVPFLYDQSVFGVPPYSYYGIYKSSLTYYPFRPIKMVLNYVYNENKYAMAIDDNSTHQGMELEYKPNNRMTLGFLYQYTRQNDMYKEFVVRKGDEYAGHHNIFAALDYKLNDDQNLTLMFGEYVGYPYAYPENHSALSALDTRHIIRVNYSGSWGEPRSPLPRGGEGQGEGAEFWNPLGPMSPEIPGAKFISNLYPGLVKYREKAAIRPVESEWDAFYTKLEFGLDAYDKEDWEGSLRFGLFGSFTEEEIWEDEIRGQYQRNDMNLNGADINANIGWAVVNDASRYISFTPQVNAGYRRIEFKRSNFSYSGTGVSEIGEVDEHFNVSFLGLGGRIDYIPAEKFNLYTGGFWAPFVYAPSRNELLGRMENNKGAIYHVDYGCDYTLSDKFDVSLGGFWDLQHLDRAERIDSGVVSVELPDNKLESLGLRIGGSYKF